MTEFENFLTAAQVAELFGLSVATIRKWVLLRYIPFRKIGRAVRFSASEIQEWVTDKAVRPSDVCRNEQQGELL
jgi:excisionase family DNA binding protein